MADRAFTAVGVRQEDHVAFLDAAIPAAQEAVNEAAELANDHLARRVGDHREGIALFADTGRHRGAHQGGVHLDTGIAQRVLDDIKRDRIDGLGLKGARIGLNDTGGHGAVLQGLPVAA